MSERRERMKKSTAALVVAAAILGLSVIPTEAVAAPIGLLNLANCNGGGFTVTNVAVTFFGNCIQTGQGTSVVTSFGTLLPAATGTIQNLPVTPPGSPFMTF